MSEQPDETRPVSVPQEWAAAASDKGPLRQVNEDAFFLPDDEAPTELGFLYIVADGVGGQQFGADASRIAVKVVQEVFYAARGDGQAIDDALRQAAAQANTAVYDEAQSRDAYRMGCTLVAAVHHNGRRHLMHVGDARAYLLREHVLTPLTQDDTWVRHQQDAGLIGDDTAAHHNLRHVVTRVLGNKESVEVTLAEPESIQAGDVLMLSTDGLHGTLSNDEMSRLLHESDPQTAADALVQAAVVAETSDNVTALVIHSGSPPEQLAPTVPMDTWASPEAVEPLPDVAERPAGRSPLTVALVSVIAVAVIVALLWVLWTAFRNIRAEVAPTRDAAATVPAEQTAEAAGEGEMAPTATWTPEPAEPTATAEAAILVEPTATEPAIPTPPLAATPTVTPTAEANIACIVSPNAITFVWLDEQILGTACDQFAREGFALSDGQTVIVIDATPRAVLGPDPTFCQQNLFVKVRSQADPGIEGWVLASLVESAAPGETCPAP